MKKFLFILFLFLGTHVGLGQETRKKWTKTSVLGNISYIIEDSRALECMIGKGIHTKGHDYVFGLIGFGAYKLNSWVPYPLLGIKSAKIFNNSWGFNLNSFLWYPFAQNNKMFIFSPEIGVRWSFIEIGFGYNMPTKKGEIEVSNTRFTIRLGI